MDEATALAQDRVGWRRKRLPPEQAALFYVIRILEVIPFKGKNRLQYSIFQVSNDNINKSIVTDISY